MKKRLISILTAVMMAAVSMPVSTVCAETTDESAITMNVQPRYQYADTVKNELNINGTAATCYSEANAQPGVTRIVISHYLKWFCSG